MSTLQPDEGDVSERELLVDDIQRIREALRVTADAVNKLSSEDEEDDEEDDEEFEEEEEEENEQPCAENASLKHQTSFKLPHQTENFLSASKHGFTLTSEGEVLQEENCNGQEGLNERTPFALASVDNQGLISGLPFQAQGDTDSLTSQNHNFSSEEVILTELQPVCFQPPVCNLNTSQGGHTANSWPVELNQHHHQLQEEHGPQYNDDADKELDCDYGMSSEIQQCLSLNRDYQLVILDELERIEHALKRNKQKQMGLHQMRANKDDTKPEPHTLIKFANPYFKDSSSLGPPDNDDTKVKRQSSQVGGYQIPSRCWNLKEQNSLAEGVRMQNLESKLSPVLQKIKKLEGKKEKTKRELKELEDLKAESVRIRNLGKETLERDLEDIDWDKLSSKYLPKRSGLECRLQWCNFGHPDVNRTAWTKEEDKKLIKLAKDPQNNWDIIAQKLQTKRTPIHCYERYQRSLNKNLLKSKWSPEDDQQLLEVVRIVGLGNWPRVASFLEGRHGDQCLHRYTQTLQMVRKGKWEKHEDELLKKAIDKYGPCNWSKLSDMVPGRSGPQCRERWVNALDPKIEKGPWTKEQDKDLLENVNKFGKGNWSKIARAMGNRTDNQCWRRWIVICKDDSLHYRQNTLRKRRELVANFTGRRQERPELEPEDLDIPDIPVVRKRKGRAPRPIEEARAMRRATQRKFRERKRAERREAERIRAEEEKAEKERKRAQKATNNGGGDQIEAERMKVQEEIPRKECKEGQKEANTGSEEDKFPRTRKAGGNRNRVQQPHHRVLMRDKQLSKRKQVAEKKEQRHTISSGGEKQVAVSGSLGPFSLLLQAFSIDIATVLKAIQQTGTTPSSVSSTSTSVGPNTSASVESKEVNSNEEQPQGQTCGGVERMEAQRETVGNETLNPDLHISTLDKQTSVVAKNHEEAEQSTDTESRVNKEKHSEISDTLELDNTDTESSLRKEIPDTRTNKEAPGPGENAHSGSDRVGALNKPPAAGSAVLASQAARRRAPAIPPLPPCYTTLKTYKSLQLLRPHLQKIAAMLKTVPRVSSTVSSTFGQSSSLNKSGSHGNDESSGTSGCGNEVTGANQPNRSNLVNKTDDNEGSLGGEIENDRDVSLENPLDKEGNNVSELNNESSISVGHEAKLLKGTETAAAQSRFNRNGKKETLSSENPSPSPMRVVTPTATVNEKGNGSSTTGVVTNGPVQSNRQQAETVIPLNNTSYRNSYEYRMLSSRFNSLFCWPALLSRIPVNRSSQIGPVFAERHPPPRGGIQSTKPKILTFRRKQRGLAAVRMASSASFSTPGQQMVSLGQGFAIKKNVPPTQLHKETSGSKDVVVAASQLLSLQESTRSLSLSTAKNTPCNTRQNKRKITPVKRYSNQECEAKKKKIVLSSDSYSSPSEDDDDDEDESDYVPGKEIRNVREFRPAPNTRQSSLRNMVPQTPKDSLSVSSVQAGSSSSTTGNVANNADEIIWDDHGNSIDHNTNETGPFFFQGDINGRVRQVEEVSEQDVSDVTRPQNNNTSISSSKGNAMPKRTGGARWRAMLPRVNDSGDTDVDTE